MNDWSWWAQRLAGAPIQANPDNPQLGFFRQSHKAFYGARKTFTPVCYYSDPDTGELRCRIGDEDMPASSVKAMQAWNHVNQHPVSEEAYRAVAEHGQPWPDEHLMVSLSNLPPADLSYDGLRDAIDDLAREANKRIEGPPIESQDEADQIANLTDRLAELWKQADAARKEEKRPHDEGALAVQKKWAPILLAAEAYKNLKYKLLTPWLKRLEEARKKEAEAAAAAGAPVPLSDTRRPRAGTRGRAMSLATTKRAEITDYDACLAYFKESPDVKGAVQDLANRAVRAGMTVPGVNVVEETTAR